MPSWILRGFCRIESSESALCGEVPSTPVEVANGLCLVGRQRERFRVLLPADEHGIEVAPAVKGNHDEVSRDKAYEAQHGGKVPDTYHQETAQEPRQHRELHWLVVHESGDDGECSRSDC